MQLNKSTLNYFNFILFFTYIGVIFITTEERKNLKDLIKNYNVYKASLRNLEQQKEDMITNNMGINYANVVYSSGNKKHNSTVENSVLDIEHSGIDKEICILQIKIKALDNAFGVLGDEELTVVKDSIIKEKPYYAIAMDLLLSERTTRRYLSRALDKMAIVIYGVGKAM